MPTTWVPMPGVSAPGAVDASPAQGSGGRPEVPNKVARLRCVGSLLAIMCAARLCVGYGGFAYVCFRRQVTKVGIMLLAWASSGAGRCGMACGRAPECITSPSSFLGPLPRSCPSSSPVLIQCFEVHPSILPFAKQSYYSRFSHSSGFASHLHLRRRNTLNERQVSQQTHQAFPYIGLTGTNQPQPHIRLGAGKPPQHQTTRPKPSIKLLDQSTSNAAAVDS